MRGAVVYVLPGIPASAIVLGLSWTLAFLVYSFYICHNSLQSLGEEKRGSCFRDTISWWKRRKKNIHRASQVTKREYEPACIEGQI